MSDRAWVARSIQKIEADFKRCADTHLLPFRLPGYPSIDFYLKDESAHPTGSLKHRLARSLFLYALCNNWLTPNTAIVEASSGSTAVSEAYFARLIGLPFIAVIPAGTSPEKVQAISFYGGQCHFVDSADCLEEKARSLAARIGGYFMDQFTNAERATDWRANNNIAESIFHQMDEERYPIPSWIVCNAGTGGTAATLGRYVRYRRHSTRIACTDPENSAFFSGYCEAILKRKCDWRQQHITDYSRIEGIGRTTIGRSFLPHCIDAMIKVPDALSLAAMRSLSLHLGHNVGGSTGTNMVGMLLLAADMHARKESGSIVSILCDSGTRYTHNYYSSTWYAEQGIDCEQADAAIENAVNGRGLPDSIKTAQCDSTRILPHALRYYEEESA